MLLIKSILQEVIDLPQGKVITMDSNVQTQSYKLNVLNRNASTYISYIFDGTSQIDYKLCLNPDMNHNVCINEPIHTIYNQGIYEHKIEQGLWYLHILNINENENIKFVWDNAAIIQEHQNYVLKPMAGTIGHNFMLFSCSNEQIHLYREYNVIPTFYFTKELNGYVGPDNCTDSETQICNIKANVDDISFTLSPGLWRASVVFEGTGVSLLRFNQTQIFNIHPDGGYQDFSINSVNHCRAYLNVSVEDFYGEKQDYIKQIAAMATHKQQLQEGGINMEIFANYPLNQSEMYMQSQTGNLTFSKTDMRTIAPQDKAYFFISLGQVNNQFIHTTEIKNTDAQIVFAYNVRTLPVGRISQSLQLKPFNQNETNQTLIETGTARYAYNFYYDLPKISKVHNLLDNTTKNVELDYIFAAASTNNAQCFQSVNVDSVNGDELTTQIPYTNDLGFTGTYTKLKATTQTNLDQGEISATSVVFQKIQLYNVGEQAQVAGMIATAKEMLEISTDTQVDYSNEGVQEGLLLKVNPNNNTAETKQYIVKVSACSTSDQIGIYWSYNNVLVNKYDHYGFYVGEGNTEVNIDTEIISQPLYLNIVHDQHCKDIRVQIMSKNDVVEIKEGDTAEVELEENQTIVYQVGLQELYNKGNKMFLKADYTGSSDLSSKVSIAVTKELYYGDAANAPHDILLNYAFIWTEHETTSIMQEFKHISQDFVYVTITNKLDSPSKIKFLISQPIQLINDNIVAIEQKYENPIVVEIVKKLNITQKLNVTYINSQQLSVDFCPYIIPYSYDMQNCKSVQISRSQEIDLDQYLKQGNNYMFVNLQKNVGVTFKLIESTILEAGKILTQSQISEGTKYYELTVDKTSNKLTLLKLYQCTNCYICVSDQIYHPQISVADLSKNQCTGVLGNVSTITDIYIPQAYTYNGQSDKLYLAVHSLNPLSEAQQIIFGAYEQEQMSADQYYNTTIEYKYKPLDARVQLVKNDEISDYTSIMLVPYYDNVFKFSDPKFNIYVTDNSSVANYGNAKYSIIAQGGNPVLILNNSELFADTEIVDLSIRVEMLENAVYQPINCSLIVGFTNKTMNINNNVFAHSANLQGKKNESSVTAYNISFEPVTILLEKCKGNPTMKIGSNDYFNVLPATDTQSSFNGQKIYRAEAQNENYEVITIQQPQYKGNQAFIQTYSENGDYDAQLTVSTYDIRPGTPIKSLTIMRDEEKVTARFHPAIDYIESGILDYSIYVIKDYKDQQQLYGNPHSSCGMMEGIQLSQWQEVDKSKSFVEINSSYSKDTLVDLDYFYITVVAKSRLTGKSILYDVYRTTWNNIQIYTPMDNGDNKSNNAGLIAGVVIGCLIVVAIIVCVVIYFVKRNKAYKQVQEQKSYEEFQEQRKPAIQI